MKTDVLSRWTAQNSADLYGIGDWGSGFFEISESGRVLVRPMGKNTETTIELMAIIEDLSQRGLRTPALLRFSNITATKIRQINECFTMAMEQVGYKGKYRGVYPIKVNQKQQIVRDIMDFGGEFHHGLEAGSKAELLCAMAIMSDPEAAIICNGYKDEEFVDLALSALKMGIKTTIVVEMPSELDIILSRAAALGVRPSLGIRAKLASRAGGHWDTSGGDRSKFGLDSSQIIDLLDRLRSDEMLDCLRLLHYHLGSQIPDIRKIRSALQEACQVYVNLVEEGAAMGMIDVGGGLAVDYDGSHTNFSCSRNYSVLEYAADVVEVIMNAADAADVPHPTIVTESGRATVAHHAVLVFNVLHARKFEPQTLPDKPPPGLEEMVENLFYVRDHLSARNAQESYHDAVYYRDQARGMFLHGGLSLREKALAEGAFWDIIHRISNIVEQRKYVPDEMLELTQAVSDVYYANFSLFQSLPDSWAIDQLFPIMPIHRLNEMPTRHAVLADISCDSDGTIDRFIDLRDVKRRLPLHELNSEDYYLGAFLVGAYQETLGDMHNLLGDVNSVHLRVTPKGEIEYLSETPGDSVSDVLSYVDYVPAEISELLREKTRTAAERGRLSDAEAESILGKFDECMKGYTYFKL